MAGILTNRTPSFVFGVVFEVVVEASRDNRWLNPHCDGCVVPAIISAVASGTR
jgi:uncharacterized membrane protein